MDAALLKAVLETVLDGILTIDETGAIITANPAVERIFGYTVEELVGENVKKLMPEPYHGEHDQYLGNYAATGDRKIIGIGREVSGLRKDGSVFPMELAVGESNTIRGRIFTGIVRDISERMRAQEDLRRERGLLRAVVETAVDGIITIDERGTIISANPATIKLFGYSSDELIGQNVRMLMPAPYHDEHDQYLANFLETGVKKIIGIGREVRGLRKNGESFPLDLAVSETLTEQGLIFTGIMHDITERKQAEEELRETHGRLTHLLTHSPAVIYALKIQGSEIKPYMVSENVTELLGFEVEETLSFDWWMVHLHVDDREREIARLVETISRGSSRSEYRMEHKRGGYRYVEDIRRITYDGAQNPQEIVGVWTDITERKEIEHALRTSEERFREMLENIELIAMILDTEACVTFCNDHLLHVTGWKQEEVLGEDWISLFITEPDQARLRSMFRDIHSDGVRTHEEIPICTKSGEVREILWNNTMLRDSSGRVVGVAVIGQDVTDRNRATAALQLAFEETERQVQERTAALATANEGLHEAVKQADAANLAKSNFLSRMSHEFRTPMNAILGFGQLLELSVTDEKQRESIHQILKGGRHLLGLINDVLEIARIETGSLGISLDKVALAEVLLESVSLMQPMADDRGIELKIDETPAVYVIADRQRLRQVVLNLLSNSIKYNVKNGTVGVTAVVSDQGTVEIEVSDTGAGIPKALQERLFAPFDRLGAEAKGIEGTGLGLSLSKALTEAMGGTLTVDSTEGEGSRFRIRLAVTEIDSMAQGVPAPANLQEVDANVRKSKILVIEDNLTNVELLVQVFAQYPNFSLVSAMQGRLGLELATEQKPDVILLDLHLPDMTGRDVLLALRADPELRNIPVIIVSADAFSSQADALLASGAFRYITKPFLLSELMSAVDQALAEP